MPLGVRPTVDFAFKLLLGSPDHTSITVHFLNAVLGGSTPITRVTILNPFLEKESDEGKFSVLDVRAEDGLGRQLNIEMQTSLPAGLAQRLTYYVSCLYVDQLKEGDGYVHLRPAVSICVLERALFPEQPQLHLGFQLRDLHGLTLADELQIHLVELSKSRATAHNLNEVSPLERWAFFLRHAEVLEADQVRELLPEPEFDEAVGVLEMIVRTPEQESLYQARLKFQRDEVARLEQARAEGEQLGQARGEQLGQARGELIGQIKLLERLLGAPSTSDEELRLSTTEQLTAKVVGLQHQFEQRAG